MKRKFIINLCMSLVMALFAIPAFAQEMMTVTGTVVDETGEPVIGATVIVAGEKGSGVITDFDGNYTIKVPKGKKVTISYIGYISQTVAPGGKVQLKEDAQSLEEVVVVGYGVQKKAHLTGSVATVDMNDIQDLSSGNLASTLSGLVNGLGVSGGESRPGERATLKVRDVNSFSSIGSAAQEPLFVIDGYIYPNDIKVGNNYQNLGAEAFNNLDASEIESITVLKDASAAVYGARAANGVILVTTKKGKVGAPRISYSGTFGFTNEVSRPKMLSTYDYGRLYNAIKAADPTNTTLNNRTDLFQADELEAMKSLNYDLLDKYWDTGFTMQHSINVSGATDNVNYFAGGSYFSQDGNLGKLDYDRWNYRAGVDVKISKWLGANLTVSGDYGKKNTPLVKVGGSGDEKDYNLLLTRPGYIPENVNGYDIVAFGVSNTEKNQNQYYNFATLQNNGDYSRSMTSNMNINGSLSYDFGWSKILKGLKLRFSYSKSINTDKGNQYGSMFNIYQMVQRYGSGNHLYTPTAGDDPDFNYLAETNFLKLSKSNGDFLYRTMTRTDNYQMNFTAQYARAFGDHDVSALFSIEKSEAESEYLLGQREKPYEFTTGQYNSATGEMTTQFTRSESGTLSYIGRLNYSYLNKYLFEVLVRSDASTKFAPKNYWGTFPAVSAGWVISEENWFKDNVKFMDFLKLRASFGLTGRDNLAAWQWMQIYAQDANRGTVFGEGMTNDSGNRITINKNNSAVNADVHWDKSYKFNLGIDAHFLNQRLAVTLEAYREQNREMLINLSQQVPSTVGTQSASTNVGEIDNWGYELSLTWKDKIGKDFKYHIGLNTGYSDNKMLVKDWPTTPSYKGNYPGHRSDTGTWGYQCIGMFRSFQEIYEYVEKYHITEYPGVGTNIDALRPGMLIYKDVRGEYNSETGTYDGPDGKINGNDHVELSHRGNPYGFTINAGANYKDFSITFQLGAHWGGYTTVPGSAIKVNGDIDYCNMPSFWNPDNMFVYEDIRDAKGNIVVAANRDAYYPNLAYANVNAVESSFWRISSARVSLNRMTLAYALPGKVAKALGIQSARVNVTGVNLLSFYNPYPEHFMDPMAGSYGSYPALRKWTVGINLTF